ncbi:hypothetical protein RUND412_007042 [Rhizina undulata]
MFWQGQDVGMGILALIPSTQAVYPLLGRPQDSLLPADPKDGYVVTYPEFLGFQYDASTTNLSYALAGDVKIVLSFTSPITGDSIERQSIPASYLEIHAEGSVDIDVYIDINGMWVTNDRGAVIDWGFSRGTKIQNWAYQKQQQSLFTENNDRAEWGTMYFSSAIDPSITYECNVSGLLRRKFAQKGTLKNSYDTNFRPVMDEEPVFAYANHFSLSPHAPSSPDSISSASALFTLAFVQDLVVQFQAARGLTQMRPLWSFFSLSASAMVEYHYLDYAKAYALGKEFADKVINQATKIAGSTYADIVSLSARQVMGATIFSGTPNDPILFLKEISSNGNFQTVDVIFPGFTFFLYVNPQWLAYLIEPLLEHQKAGWYPNKYSIHDLGAHFPNATGHPDGLDEPMPVEECGNMLVMGVAYAGWLAQQEDKGKRLARNWINKDGRYALWQQWAKFLIEEGLIPDLQLSTDDFAGRLVNQTNLAAKALVGIRAMADLSKIMENDKDWEYYRGVADSYMPVWKELALSRDGTHTKLAYHWFGSWGTLYNIYPDSLLCFHKGTTGEAKDPGYVPYDIYRTQSRWYSNVIQKYGLPLDSRHLYTKSDWELWAAAISSAPTRQKIVDAVGLWLNETVTDRPFTDLYDTETGDFPGINFMARPVVGGHFSILALDQACGGTGLSYLEENVFGNFEEEVIAGSAINVQKSLLMDREHGFVDPNLAVPRVSTHTGEDSQKSWNGLVNVEL